MKSHHCRHCGDKHDKLKPSYRRWSLDKLLPAVREIVQRLPSEERRGFTAERICTELRAKKPLVEQCLHKLNLEGLITQGVNRAPHDSTRDRMCPGPDSAWAATVYYLREDKP